MTFILNQLIGNAVRYRRENPVLIFRAFCTDDGISLSIEDNGIGITREDSDRVFERFYRVDKSLSKEIGGTGLGLSIVKHGVAFLGGTLELTSEVDSGTEITVTLPKQA